MSKRKPFVFTAPEKSGPKVWRSLDEKGQSDEERRKAASEERRGGFLGGLLDPRGLMARRKVTQEDREKIEVSRREFMAGSTAAAAAATLSGCIRRPEEHILPYALGPEYSVPGVPTHFATVLSRGADALGVIVTSHEGRPTKIEGNPTHPSSRGATDAFAQLDIWNLYDPDRSRKPFFRTGDGTVETTVSDFDAMLVELGQEHLDDAGQGLRFLSPPTNSPTFRRLRESVRARFPQATFHRYASITNGNAIAGAKLAFGRSLNAVPNFADAKVILAVDSDFLGTETGSTRASREFASKRKINTPSEEMSRLYVVEPGHSITGAQADHRLRLPSSQAANYLKALGKALAAKGANLGPVAALVADGDATGLPATWLDEVANELTRAAGGALIVVGENQPPEVHALAHGLNMALGAVGRTIAFYPTAEESETTPLQDLAALAGAMESVRTLVVLGGNPVYEAPGDIDLAAAFGREGLRVIHVGSHRDETAAHAHWHCPLAHELEAWGDQRAIDGTMSIQQPLIAPLHGARSAIEVLAILADEPNWRGHKTVQATFRASGPASFSQAWRGALHSGVVANSGSRPASIPAAVNSAGIAAAFAASTQAAVADDAFEVRFVPSSTVYDGRFTNNLWALELPDTMTKLVWDNAALISKTTRDRLGLRNGAMVRLTKGERSMTVPVWTLPGHADNVITMSLGWGRTAAGRYGTQGAQDRLDPLDQAMEIGGFDVAPLRTSADAYFATGVSVEKVSGNYTFVQTQTHAGMEGRPLAIDATVEQWREEEAAGHLDFASYRTIDMSSIGPLWEQVEYDGRKWGMTIDLSACSGCNACVVACQSENNIPAVGKREVQRGREMAWIRIDRYFVGESDDDPGVALQPVACQQCEEAPCENVCPVNATAHSPEGLNDMAYNRCIGTRYCANNCPYKVRRFNYLDWHSHLDDRFAMHGSFPETRKMAMNPNVTVRMRGVMEKCTYCVQRIQAAKIKARRERREMVDGDVTTACQAVCPTAAITFGDLNDETSRVARLVKSNRQYKLLAEVGTQPRTTFLAKIRNANPAMETA